MTANRLRRGSALLIVLGMMSFMLFSGLAFAVYMRYSRLPTSFLRRTTTTRQLAKAALAEAIEEIDTAIADDPHPGVSKRSYVSGVAANTWRHRIFFGSDLTGVTEKSITPSQYAPSVLTLEGLAYLPPNLVNDVRYYSRCTPTADWQPFWFDSGRYAYVAVDVSDYFDVNRLLANERRAASSSQRITLAHLFEKVSEGSDGIEHKAGSGADAWDQFIDETCGDSEPFVSLADFNIAWGTGSKTFGGQSVANPFRQFVNKGYAYGENVTAADPKAEYYRQLTFVTDSWSPTPKRTDGITVADLEDATYQPFKRSDLESTSGKDISAISDGIGSSKLLNDEKYLGQKLCDLSCYALWDYLDENKQPVSLALPTCEQVPMVCAIQPEFNGSFSFTREDGPDEVLIESKTSKIVKRDVTYAIVLKDVGSDMNVFAAWAYPFLSRGSGENNGSDSDFKFALDGRVALFLSAEGADVSARPKGEVAGLYFKDKGEMQKGDVVNDSVLTYPLKSKELTLPSDKTVPVKEEQFKVAKGDNSEVSNARKLFTITYQWDKKKSDNPNYTDASQAIAINQPDGDAKFGFFQQDGENGLKLSKEFSLNDIKAAGIKLDVNAAVWMRVTDGSDKTFDLVPAGIVDDKQFLGVNNSNDRSYYEKADSGGTHPLLSVKASQPITISLETLNDSKGSSYALTGKTLMTGDPRFNHAPENWKITSAGGTDTKTMWYNAEKAEAEKDGCDGDIYMATSDQGYMQSVYELMMLPRIQTAGIKKSGVGDGFKGSYDKNFNGKIRSETETLKDRGFMWRTYRPEDFDEIDDGRIVSGDSGPKVNPYSDSTNVLMAAFANTPHDWRVASTNNEDTMSMKADEFNKAHAWNSYSTATGGKLCWERLSDVAGAFSQKARESGDWETAFRELDWNFSDPKYILSGGEELKETDGDNGKLYSVDKKFLYGFWHDSFSARQQLFLIFVRAEPMMMGGGVAGQAPPQLGARAVALVWREPSAFADAKDDKRDDNSDTSVHRTRVLFYHQFD